MTHPMIQLFLNPVAGPAGMNLISIALWFLIGLGIIILTLKGFME